MHAAMLMFTGGILVAILGAPAIGLSTLLLAVVIWPIAITSAWVAALRTRGGKPWFGPRSVMEDANYRTGWSDVRRAALSVGADPNTVRRVLIGSTAVTIAFVPLWFVSAAIIR